MQMTMRNPNFGRLVDHIRHSAKLGLPMVEQGRHADAPGFVVCGTAPSLVEPENIAKVRELAAAGYIVVALKEALRVLTDLGITCHYTVAMDPDAKQIAKTPIIFGVTYCIASSCSPELFDYLLSNGCRVEVFHSATGVEAEQDLYRILFGKGDCVQGGYTLGNRATGLAAYMGTRPDRTFVPIFVAGVMFGWRDGQSYYAEGVTGKPGNAGPQFDDDGKIDGTTWFSKLDLMASAIHLARMVRMGFVTFIGDSLAQSLSKHTDEYLERVVKKTTVVQQAQPVRPPKRIAPRLVVRDMLQQVKSPLLATLAPLPSAQQMLVRGLMKHMGIALPKVSTIAA